MPLPREQAALCYISLPNYQITFCPAETSFGSLRGGPLLHCPCVVIPKLMLSLLNIFGYFRQTSRLQVGKKILHNDLYSCGAAEETCGI